MALALRNRDALVARLAGMEVADWPGPARAAAAKRLQNMGLPLRRDEYWRYTNPDDYNAVSAPCAAIADPADEPEPFAGIDRLRIVFVDGVFDPAASDDLSLAGVEIDRLATAPDLPWVRDLFGTLEARGQVPVARPLAAVNSAYAPEGVLIRVTGRAVRPVALIYRQETTTSDVMLHHCIRMEAGAELTLLESGTAAARLCTVMEVDLAPTARLHHIRTQGSAHDRREITHLFARLAGAARLKSFTMTANGVLTRNEAVVELLGFHARAVFCLLYTSPSPRD